MIAEGRLASRLRHWLLEEDRVGEAGGPHVAESGPEQHPWWKVFCLTGLDYYSTLGYQPGIAALAAGALSPIATLLLVLLTLFGAVPMYRRVAAESPHGQGSILMLERLLSFWKGKLFVLCLLGFIATDYVVTITLSASDAASHFVKNPLVSGVLQDKELVVTLVLVTLLGAVFLKGFKEAIGIAVSLVSIYLLLNFVVVGVGLYECFVRPQDVANWTNALLSSNGGNPLLMVGLAILVFPKLALGSRALRPALT